MIGLDLIYRRAWAGDLAFVERQIVMLRARPLDCETSLILGLCEHAVWIARLVQTQASLLAFWELR